jgi:hypothetical protein
MSYRTCCTNHYLIDCLMGGFRRGLDESLPEKFYQAMRHNQGVQMLAQAESATPPPHLRGSGWRSWAEEAASTVAEENGWPDGWPTGEQLQVEARAYFESLTGIELVGAYGTMCCQEYR